MTGELSDASHTSDWRVHDTESVDYRCFESQPGLLGGGRWLSVRQAKVGMDCSRQQLACIGQLVSTAE